MTIFLWTMLVLIALSVIGNLSWLVSREFPLRTAQKAAIDVAVNVCILAWIVVLLSK